MTTKTRREVLEGLRARLSKLPHAQAAGQFFSTAVGKEVLRALDAEFVRGDLVGATDAETYFNLGAREVALYLQRLAGVTHRDALSTEGSTHG